MTAQPTSQRTTSYGYDAFGRLVQATSAAPTTGAGYVPTEMISLDLRGVSPLG